VVVIGEEEDSAGEFILPFPSRFRIISSAHEWRIRGRRSIDAVSM